jgi:hypothetical protein
LIVATPAIRIRDASELQLEQRNSDFTGMTAQALADFQPYLDANEQDEAGLTQIAGSGAAHDAALDDAVNTAANAAGFTISGDVVQSQTDLHNSASGRTALANQVSAIDLTGQTFVQNLAAPMQVPKQYQHPPPGDVLITKMTPLGRYYNYWPANKPLPPGFTLVSQAELDSLGSAGQNAQANSTQAGG